MKGLFAKIKGQLILKSNSKLFIWTKNQRKLTETLWANTPMKFEANFWVRSVFSMGAVGALAPAILKNIQGISFC